MYSISPDGKLYLFPRKLGMATMYRAYKICWTAFGDEVHKDGKPARDHSLRIAEKFASYPFGMNCLLMSIAYLHDVVEDTDWTLDRLRAEGFDKQVIEAVDAISRRDGESYSHYIRRVLDNPLAMRVKIRDIEDNLLRMTPEMEKNRPMYEKSLEKLREAVGIPDSIVA